MIFLRSYILSGDLRGKNFIESVNLCFELCSKFSLGRSCFCTFDSKRALESGLKTFDEADEYNLMTYSYVDNENFQNLSAKLKPFYITNFKTSRWHCYIVDEKNPLEIFLYDFNDESKNIILDTFDNIFLNADFVLEDICFFKENGDLLLGTVSHEGMCNLFLDESLHDEYYKNFSSVSIWEYSEKMDSQRINLNDYL